MPTILRARSLLFTSYGEPRLLVPGLIGVIAAFIVALTLITFTNRPRTDEQRADTLMRSGKPAQAERIYARLLKQQPSVPLALSVLDAHDQARLLGKIAALRDETRPGTGMGLPDPEAPMSE